MHLKRISKYAKKRIIAGMMASVLALGGLMMFKHQTNKINDLKQQLEMKQDIDHKNQGMYSTTIDAQTIRSKFNEANSYKVFEGTMVLKHKYEYQRDSWIGLKSKGTLVANAKCYYEFQVDLRDAVVTVDYDTNVISVKLPRAKLNKNCVHMVNNTFKVVEKESKDNILMNEKDGKQLQRYWIESFNTNAIDKINEYYDSGTMRDKLEEYARKEVVNLINTLGLNRTDVKIEIK